MSQPMYKLTKGSPVNFSKESVAPGVFRVETIWDFVPAGFDLDLTLMWKSRDGQKSVMQGLGRLFGSETELPFMRLHGDDRTGQVGELVTGDTRQMLANLSWIGIGLNNYVEGRRAEPLSHVRGAKTTIKLPGQPPMVVEHDGMETSVCSIAQIFIEGENLRFENDVEAVRFGGWGKPKSPQRALDAHWGVDLPWTSGHK